MEQMGMPNTGINMDQVGNYVNKGQGLSVNMR